MKYPSQPRITLLHGDAATELKNLPDNSVDLIVTSPPYADQRKHIYGGISPDLYVEWFLPLSAELLRVLKPTGTFILNIKERVVNGERTYVCAGAHFGNAQTGLALDRRIHVAQEELLPREMAQSLSGFVGAFAPVQQTAQIQYAPGSGHG